MSTALKPPSGTIANITGINGPLGSMQTALSGIEWLKYSLGQVVPQVVNGRAEPWIYVSNGEYYPAYPNDMLTSVSCLYAHEDEQTDDTGILFTRTVSVIVWLNLKTLKWERVDLEMAKLQVRQALRDLACVHSIDHCYDQTATGSQGIYPGFDLSGLESRYLTYPFAGFRIETTVGYADLCIC